MAGSYRLRITLIDGTVGARHAGDQCLNLAALC